MSHAQQTCPFCSWERFVPLPDGLEWELAESVGRHVARSLQWEWQAHAIEAHPLHGTDMQCLTPGAFHDWVKREGDAPEIKMETPPSEGVGKTVRVNLPTITPEQAKQLAEAVERTMVSVADSIQNFATHAVPAIHAAQQTLTDGLRRIVEQWPRSGCACNGGQGDHQPGQDGCLFKPYTSPLLSGAAARQLAWEKLYGKVPLLPEDAQAWRKRWDETSPAADAPANRAYGTVDAEICSNCQRLAGEPHGLPSCAELS